MYLEDYVDVFFVVVYIGNLKGGIWESHKIMGNVGNVCEFIYEKIKEGHKLNNITIRQIKSDSWMRSWDGERGFLKFKKHFNLS